MNSFYSQSELEILGFQSVGNNVKISRKASFYDITRIRIGHNVRIDDFCILSGQITLGDNIHISAYSALYGAKGIEIHDYSGLSPRSTIFSAMDDFSGEYLIGPIHSPETINVTGGKVVIERYCQIGAGSIIFPNLKIGEGSVVGSMSLVNKSLEPWGIFAGIPVRLLKERKKNLLKFI
ncbi:MAG: acyltransferase [Muribaculaceae bacterium]|nr:acyltransferase [Muribaculaceae bacterium]